MAIKVFHSEKPMDRTRTLMSNGKIDVLLWKHQSGRKMAQLNIEKESNLCVKH